MNRGGRGEQVFELKDDYECFMAVALEAIEIFALRVSALAGRYRKSHFSSMISNVY